MQRRQHASAAQGDLFRVRTPIPLPPAETRQRLLRWNARPADLFPQIATGIYSGTSMLNRLLERKGRRLGIIVTAALSEQFFGTSLAVVASGHE